MRSHRDVSSSTASSTRPTLLHRSTKSNRGITSPSASLSAWVPGMIFRKPVSEPSHRSEFYGNGQGRLLERDMQPNIKVDGDRKTSFLTRDRANRHKKSVTIEEPKERVSTESESEAGTIKKSTKSGCAGLSSSFPSQQQNGVDGKVGETQRPQQAQESDIEVAFENTKSPESVREYSTANPQTTGSLPNGDMCQPSRSRKRSRTVSRDDYLTARGANPRTGVVSPSVTNTSLSDVSGSRLKQPSSLMSQKWRLKGDQWISLNASETTPLPTPSEEETTPQPVPTAFSQTQKHIGHLPRTDLPFDKLEDKLVVNMPSAREPCPPTMTREQILDYQKAIERVHRNNEEMVDPDTAPTPRAITPEGRSTPPRKLTKLNPLKFIKRNRGEPSPKQDLADHALIPSLEPCQDRRQEKERDYFYNGKGNLEQGRNAEQGRVTFLENKGATESYQPKDVRPQTRNGCPTSLNQRVRPRADSLQERRLLRKDQANSLVGPIPILHLEKPGEKNVSTPITTTTTTSTIMSTLPCQVNDITSADQPAQTGAEDRFSDSTVLTTSLNAAIKDGSVPSVETVHMLENMELTTAYDTIQGTEMGESDGCTPISEIQYGEISGVDINIPYLKLLTHFLWLFFSTLEYLLTAVICFLTGTIWICKKCRGYQQMDT